MAKTAKATKSATPARRRGRPSNASKAQAQSVSRAQQMEHVMLAAQAAGQAAAQTVMAALDPSFATVSVTPDTGSASADAGSQGTRSQSQGKSNGKSATSTSSRQARKPGRKPDPTSALSQARDFAAANKSMARADMVDAFTKFTVTTKDDSGRSVTKSIDKATANTYYHLIHGSKKSRQSAN